MLRLHRLIEPFRQLAVARQCAIPFAAVIGDPANLPLRQLEIDQRHRGFAKGGSAKQTFDPRSLCALSDRWKTSARGLDGLAKDGDCRRGGVAELFGYFGGIAEIG